MGGVRGWEDGGEKDDEMYGQEDGREDFAMERGPHAGDCRGMEQEEWLLMASAGAARRSRLTLMSWKPDAGDWVAGRRRLNDINESTIGNRCCR